MNNISRHDTLNMVTKKLPFKAAPASQSAEMPTFSKWVAPISRVCPGPVTPWLRHVISLVDGSGRSEATPESLPRQLFREPGQAATVLTQQLAVLIVTKTTQPTF